MKQLRAAEGDEAIRQHLEGLRRTAWEWRRVVDFFLEDKLMFSLGRVALLVFFYNTSIVLQEKATTDFPLLFSEEDGTRD